jgi:2-polyprenyl-6-methoxyphenol hydroxylase-like FAD-dependent oxidoreductase
MLDVIVIGARCAGAPLAMELAQQNHRILVVDRASFPSDTLSSHLMLPRGSSYLSRLGLLDDVLARTPSFERMRADFEGVVLGGVVGAEDLRKRYRQLHGDDLTAPTSRWISVRRRVLDAILVDRAREAGADIREKFLVEDLVRDGDRVVGIRGRTGSGTVVEERAQVVVGADGRHSTTVRKLPVRPEHAQSSGSFCYWGYFADLDLASIGGPQIVKRGRLRAATVPTNDGNFGVSIWGPLAWFDAFRANVERNFLRAVEYCSPAMANLIRPEGLRSEPLFGTADLANVLRPVCGPGWALIGDAAASHDQCLAIGMTHALRDAQLLACELNLAFGGSCSVDTALARYAAQRHGDHTREFHQFVCEEAQMNCQTRQELNLFAAMRGNADAQNAAVAMIADVIPRSEFHAPERIQAILANTTDSFDRYPLARRWDLTQARYQENPFLGDRLEWRPCDEGDRC